MPFPTVSVLTPMYNAESYIGACIKSILSQTYTDFEHIIVDDGSEDLSSNVVASFSDKRIRYVKNHENTGLANVRNQCLSLAKGQLIAWLDADDCAHEKRLEYQTKLFNRWPELGICGTWAKSFGKKFSHNYQYPIDSETLKCHLLFHDPFVTSSVMIRVSEIFERQLKFDVHFPTAEDYDYWERLSHTCQLANIPHYLTYYRLHLNQASLSPSGLLKQINSAWKVQERLLRNLSIKPSPDERDIHQNLGNSRTVRDSSYLNNVYKWLNKIQSCNKEKRQYPEETFNRVLEYFWFVACRGAARNGFSSWRLWKSFSFTQNNENVSILDKIEFYFRCIIKWRNR